MWKKYCQPNIVKIISYNVFASGTFFSTNLQSKPRELNVLQIKGLVSNKKLANIQIKL